MDAEAFWKMYEEQLRASGLHPKAVAWCRKRTAFFIETTKRVKLKEKTSEDIKGYFCKQLASGRLEDWQYEQLVDALRVLFLTVVKAPWAQTFPWDAWKAPQLNFASEIAYFARPEVDLHASETPVRFRDTLAGMQVRERFGDELSTLREEIRRRNYSLRTEHTYETWVMRYLTFHDGHDPRNLDASNVQEYLSYLANQREVAASTQNQALSAVVFFSAIPGTG